MDYQAYSKLPLEEKVQIWADLVATPGWQLLRSFVEKQIGDTSDVKGVDDRESFYFQSVKQKGMLEVLGMPNEKSRAASLNKN